MEETFFLRPDKSMRRAQSERSISNSLVQRMSKSLFETLSMQNSNYAVIITGQLGYNTLILLRMTVFWHKKS